MTIYAMFKSALVHLDFHDECLPEDRALRTMLQGDTASQADSQTGGSPYAGSLRGSLSSPDASSPADKLDSDESDVADKLEVASHAPCCWRIGSCILEKSFQHY